MAVKIIHPALEDYARYWCGFQVDKNLKDDWLIRLNTLQCFELMGICEGHFSCDDDVAHIVLQAKNVYRKKLISEIGLASEFLEKYRDASTQYSVKAIYDFPSKHPQQTPTGWLFTISLTCLHERASFEMDNQTEEWFVRTVQDIERMDTEIEKLF